MTAPDVLLQRMRDALHEVGVDADEIGLRWDGGADEGEVSWSASTTLHEDALVIQAVVLADPNRPRPCWDCWAVHRDDDHGLALSCWRDDLHPEAPRTPPRELLTGGGA